MSRTNRTTVFVVTHGDKFSGANPRMTPEGFAQVRALRHLLPKKPEHVVTGTGDRHFDVALALGLTPSRITDAVGTPASLEEINGESVIVLANGKKVDPKLYTTLEDGEETIKKVICSLADQTVVAAGRPSMIMAGKKDAKSAAVYKITCSHIPGNSFIESIEEVVATGMAEVGTV